MLLQNETIQIFWVLLHLHKLFSNSKQNDAVLMLIYIIVEK